MATPSIDDAAASMTGLLGSTMLIGVGTAAGMATVRMMERMGEHAVPKKTKRRRKR